MPFYLTNLLIVALYIAAWADSFPTTVDAVSVCGLKKHTDAIPPGAGLLELSSDTNANSNTNAESEVPTKKLGSDTSSCGTTVDPSQVSEWVKKGRRPCALDCDTPGPSAPTAFTFAGTPTQTRAVLLVATGASAMSTTFASVATRASLGIAEDREEATMSFPTLYPDPASSLAPISDADQGVSVTVTMVVSGESFPVASTIDSTISTALLTLSSTPQIPTGEPTLQGSSLFSPVTISSKSPTSAQSTSTNSSSGATPGVRRPNQTAIIVGAIAGTLAALAIFGVALDRFVKRLRNDRRRSTSEGSDDAILADRKEEQQTAYGYYGTNRAGLILKSVRIFKAANSEPAELPADDVAAGRQ